MGFFNLSLLAGAALAALPIVLHLIMRQQPRHLEFPALRFVRRRRDANRRRLRLRHLILLALRVAAICLLAAALARPFIMVSAGAWGGQEAPVAAALVFDTNLRMEYRHENRSRLEAASETALWLLPQLPADSEVAVVDTGPGAAIFQIDLGAAKQRVERLQAEAVSRPLVEVLPDALELLRKSELSRKEVYLFTDLTQAAWPREEVARLQRELAATEGVGVYVIDVGVAEPRNFSLGQLRQSDQRISVHGRLRLSAELSNIGPGGERGVEAYLLDSAGTPQMVGRQTLQAAENSQLPSEFNIPAPDVGSHQGYVQIVGEDPLAADDRRFFTFEVQPAWRVLVAAPSPHYDRAFALTEALAPTAARETGQARFACEVTTLEDLPQRELREFAAVCLLDPAPLSDFSWQQLRDYAYAGGGVALFLGPHADTQGFNQPAAGEVLPGKLLRQARYPDGNLQLAPDDYQHPLLRAFAPLASSVPWSASPVVRYWQLGDLAADAGAVIAYSNTDAAVIERTIGAGRAITFTTPVSQLPAERAWNYLLSGGDSWPFFVLLNETMLYLVGSADVQLNYQPGQAAVIPLDDTERIASYLLMTPRGDPLRQNAGLEGDALVVTATDWHGNYRLRAGGETAGLDRGFSVNLPEAELRLDRLEDDALDDIFGENEYRLARDTDEIDREISVGRAGRELYPWLMALLAVVLGAEQVVANRFYAGRGEKSNP